MHSPETEQQKPLKNDGLENDPFLSSPGAIGWCVDVLIFRGGNRNNWEDSENEFLCFTLPETNIAMEIHRFQQEVHLQMVEFPASYVSLPECRFPF